MRCGLCFFDGLSWFEGDLRARGDVLLFLSRIGDGLCRI